MAAVRNVGILVGTTGALGLGYWWYNSKDLVKIDNAKITKMSDLKNSAFVFVKPHANTEKAREVTKSFLESKNLTILKEGPISAEEIDSKKLIDNHYYAIASKATILKPSALNVPKDKFSAQFGCDWDATLAEGKVFNAMDACQHLGITAAELDTHWAKAKKAGNLVKFGGGFYCGLVNTVEGKDPIFVMNGFFMAMRSKFVAPNTSIYSYTVEWDPSALAWEDFRGKVLGPTDPVTAPEDSLRGMFYKHWKEYGLPDVPNVGDNAVHASASPFEALCERMNWGGVPAQDDPYGKEVLKVISAEKLNDWKNDPQVTYTVDGASLKKSLFDSVEDMNSKECLDMLKTIAA